MGLRIFFILLVIWAIALIVRILMQSSLKTRSPKPIQNGEKQLVKCEYCDVHCEEIAALQYQQYHFCSQAHLDQYLQYTDNKPDG